MVDLKAIPLLIIVSFSVWSIVFFVIENLSSKIKFANRRTKYTVIFILYIFFIQVMLTHNFIEGVKFHPLFYSTLSYIGLFGTMIYVALFNNTVYHGKVRQIRLVLFALIFGVSVALSENIHNGFMHYTTILFFTVEFILIAITIGRKERAPGAKILLAAYFIVIVTNVYDILNQEVFLLYGFGVLPLFLPFYFMALYRHYRQSIKEEIIVYNKVLETEQKSYASSIYLIVDTVEKKNEYLVGHSEKVSLYATLIGTRLGLGFKDLEILNTAALLHDIGYLGIGMEQYTGKQFINIEDLRKIQQHPLIGAEILRKSSLFGQYADYVLYHHENWDGTGYPYGLKGKQIPLISRIIQIADQFDALTSDRFYRTALSVEDALLIMKGGKGVDYDPELVDALFQSMDKGGMP